MLRKIAIAFWISVILAGIVTYIARPEIFTPESIASLLSRYQSGALLVYLLLSILRGFTLLPSTPLVLAGTLIFPGQPWLVLAVSIFGILVSSSMIFWFSDLLGVSEFFETRKPEKVAKIRTRLERPSGLAFVFLWAFFPLVPTDAVCYVAGTTKMNFAKFIVAIFAGELILCSIYIFAGSYMMKFWSA